MNVFLTPVFLIVVLFLIVGSQSAPTDRQAQDEYESGRKVVGLPVSDSAELASAGVREQQQDGGHNYDDQEQQPIKSEPRPQMSHDRDRPRQQPLSEGYSHNQRVPEYAEVHSQSHDPIRVSYRPMSNKPKIPSSSGKHSPTHYTVYYIEIDPQEDEHHHHHHRPAQTSYSSAHKAEEKVVHRPMHNDGYGVDVSKHSNVEYDERQEKVQSRKPEGLVLYEDNSEGRFRHRYDE